MKIHKRIAAALLPAALLAMTSLPAAYAASANVADFDREASGAPWSYIGVRTYGSLDDLFGDAMKELVPGDARTVAVQLQNSSLQTAQFWLRAEALTEAGAKALEGEFPSKAAVDALLGHVSISVDYQGATIYAGTLGGVGTGDLYTGNGVALGTLAGGSYGTISVSLRVSEALGNDYANSMCAVNWVFTATQEDEVGNPGGGENQPGGAPDSIDPNAPGGAAELQPGGDGEDIGDEGVPEGAGVPGDSGDPGSEPPPIDDGTLTDIGDEGAPEGSADMVVIADPDTPLGLPQTGGLLTYATPAGIALVVLMALYAATYARGRKKRQGGGQGEDAA
ncbi:MAG: hypothetical protein LBJ10_07220 [Clostridiales bacterium]|jgi:hypothetical protein|nr:hypothetical protein [Clostridiales bacterium]